jgi:hypothetical protein
MGIHEARHGEEAPAIDHSLCARAMHFADLRNAVALDENAAALDEAVGLVEGQDRRVVDQDGQRATLAECRQP